MPYLETNFAKKILFTTTIMLLSKEWGLLFQKNYIDNQSPGISFAMSTQPLSTLWGGNFSPTVPYSQGNLLQFLQLCSHRTMMATAHHGRWYIVVNKSYGLFLQIIVNTRSHTAAETQFKRCHSNQSHVKLLDSRMLQWNWLSSK